MSEKEKRKEKPKWGLFGWQMISLSIISTVIIIGWLVLYPCACNKSEPTATETRIQYTHERLMTWVFATETAVVEHATATAEAANQRPITDFTPLPILSVQLTATALLGWEPYTPTPTPNP